ncbi:MAG: 2Fe-2S iron-sulfur cluster-binding protein [Thiohalocapsa sp.]
MNRRGIGVTPVLAMLHALAAAESPRQIWWLHGARNRSEHSFAEEAAAALNVLNGAHRHTRYSAPEPGDRLGVDFDAAGRINAPVLIELGVPREADFYLCGPAGFMADLSSGLARWGVPSARIHTEIFGPGTSRTPGIAMTLQKAPHLTSGPAGSGPLVSFARSGLDVRSDPRFHNLLELAEACDVPVRWACRTGVCHSCETALMAGSVDISSTRLIRQPPAMY